MSVLNRLLGRGPGKEEEFWEWFREHSEALWRLTAEDTDAIVELTTRLKRVHRDLGFQFGPVYEGVRELAITAGGVQAAFPAVVRLVEMAPELPGWEVVSFRPRVRITGYSVKTEELELAADDVWFEANPDGPKVALRLYIKGLPRKNPRPYQTAAYTLLDHALGEFDVVMLVGSIWWEPLPDNPAARGLRPLHQVPEFVDRLVRFG